MATPPTITFGSAEYGIHRETDLGYEDAVQRTTDALKEEGFGILTEIDIKATLKKKLDVDFPRYVILGACNPPLAHQALTAEPDIGLLLPCNVVVSESADGSTTVSALKPSVVFNRIIRNDAVLAIADDVEARLTRALDRVAGGD